MAFNFFRGTSVEQDGRWGKSDARLIAKLEKAGKFSDILNVKVDLKKVNIPVVSKWVVARVNEILGFEDDIVSGLVINMLESEEVDAKKLQLDLTGFLEKNAKGFCEELWTHLVDAQSQPNGIPLAFLLKKKEEIVQRQMIFEQSISGGAILQSGITAGSSASNEGDSKKRRWGPVNEIHKQTAQAITSSLSSASSGDKTIKEEVVEAKLPEKTELHDDNNEIKKAEMEKEKDIGMGKEEEMQKERNSTSGKESNRHTDSERRKDRQKESDGSRRRGDEKWAERGRSRSKDRDRDSRKSKDRSNDRSLKRRESSSSNGKSRNRSSSRIGDKQENRKQRRDRDRSRSRSRSYRRRDRRSSSPPTNRRTQSSSRDRGRGSTRDRNRDRSHSWSRSRSRSPKRSGDGDRRRRNNDSRRTRSYSRSYSRSRSRDRGSRGSGRDRENSRDGPRSRNGGRSRSRSRSKDRAKKSSRKDQLEDKERNTAEGKEAIQDSKVKEETMNVQPTDTSQSDNGTESEHVERPLTEEEKEEEMKLRAVALEQLKQRRMQQR